MRRIEIDFDSTVIDGIEQSVEGFAIPESINENETISEGDTIVEVDDSIEDEENDLPEVSNEEDNSDDYILSTVTPFSLNFINIPSYPDQLIANLFFIAQTKSAKNIILYTSYLLESEIEYEIIKDLPFSVEANFAGFRICSDIVENSFPAYVTDFDFTYDKDIEDNYKFSFRSKRMDKEGSQEIVTYKMVSDVYCGIKYIDNYIFECEVNNYELSKAAITARETDNPSEMIIVDRIERIVAMAQMKDSKTCAIEFLVTDGENKYTLLSTFNFGRKFHKKKFKGMTVDKINSVYLNEADQYLQIFSEFCRFANIDKEYLVIKAKNKDGIDKIFLIDGTNRIEFETMIEEY